MWTKFKAKAAEWVEAFKKNPMMHLVSVLIGFLLANMFWC